MHLFDFYYKKISRCTVLWMSKYYRSFRWSVGGTTFMQLMVIEDAREGTGFNLKSVLLTPKGDIPLCAVSCLNLVFSTPVTNTMCLCGLHSSLTMVWGTSCTTTFSLVWTFRAALDIFFSFSSLHEMKKTLCHKLSCATHTPIRPILRYALHINDISHFGTHQSAEYDILL